IGHRLLVTELRAGRVEIGDVGALVERGDLERRPRARRRLLEDQRDLLALQPLHLTAGVLGDLHRLRQLQQETQLPWREIDLLEKAAVAQVEHCPYSLSPGRIPPEATNVSHGRDWTCPFALGCAGSIPVNVPFNRRGQ